MSWDKNISCFAFFEPLQYLEHELDSVGLGSFLIFKFFQFPVFEIGFFRFEILWQRLESLVTNLKIFFYNILKINSLNF